MFRLPIFHLNCALLSVVFLAAGSHATASIIVQPSGLNPGDPYRLAFLTSATRNALSTDIADYNAFVTNSAILQPELAALGVFWHAIGSTASVDARDNTGTNPNSSVGVPIFLLNDTQLAANNADLWDGSIDVALNVLSDGSLASAGQLVWTGTNDDGAAAAFPLGDGFAAGQGVAAQTGQLWIAFFPAVSELSFPLYAISDVLTVPSATVPEPSSLVCFGGLMALAGWQRCRRRAAGASDAIPLQAQ